MPTTLTDEQQTAKLYTWGYQGKDHAALLAVLRQIGVEQYPTIVADVRRRPTSRRWEWRPEVIHEAVAPLVRYWCSPELGNVGCTALWERPPETDDTDTTLALLTRLLMQGNSILLLCYEADPAECHRTEVAQEIVRLAGIDPDEVVHL